jgi:hypothetical protein
MLVRLQAQDCPVATGFCSDDGQERPMKLSWFDAGAASAFGTSLAAFFAERVPPDAKLSDKKFAAKTQEVLKKMALQVDRFKAENTLNTYKKAKLGNAFKWALKDAGYEPGYVEKISEWLMLRL